MTTSRKMLTMLVSLLIKADLGLDRHVSNVCKTCFFWLRQLRRVRRSQDIESVKTLVHAFVTSRVDYCNSVFVFRAEAHDQVAACWKCCSTSGERDLEIRAWSVSADAWWPWPSLAGYSSARAAQASCDNPPLSSAPSTR